MHPARSVILFTTASGLGFGMMVWLGLGLGPAGPVAGPVAAAAALALAGVGLLASTFHLGNPQRFLMAFSQWRSSWLSREGVVAVAVMAVFGLYALLWIFGAQLTALGVVAALLALLTVICTAMIYAQLRTVPRWASPWTAPMFVAYALAGGVLAVSLARSAAGEAVPPGLGLILLACTAVAYVQRRVWEGIRLSGAAGTPESATGLDATGRVRLLESPHSSPNYVMKEMVYAVARRHAQKINLFAVLAGLFAPLFLFALFREPGGFGLPAGLATPGLALALLLHAAGAVAARWLFFAEAEHVVGFYYGRR